MPTKATVERFDDDPSLEFDHFLCLKLGWRTVDAMRRGMSAAEWQLWRVYYLRVAQRRELEQMRGG